MQTTYQILTSFVHHSLPIVSREQVTWAPISISIFQFLQLGCLIGFCTLQFSENLNTKWTFSSHLFYLNFSYPFFWIAPLSIYLPLSPPLVSFPLDLTAGLPCSLPVSSLLRYVILLFYLPPHLSLVFFLLLSLSPLLARQLYGSTPYPRALSPPSPALPSVSPSLPLPSPLADSPWLVYLEREGPGGVLLHAGQS